VFDIKKFIEATPLGDARRNKRALEIVTALIGGGEPGAADHVHAPGKASVWAHAMGRCRFYDNPDLLLPNLYEPCRAALAELVPPDRRAYVIYDVSLVDYSHHEAKRDRIRIGNKYGRGYELFSALVLDEEGRPLGPMMQELRTAQGCLSSEASAPVPFVDHFTQVDRASRAAYFHLPHRDLVEVMDREFDDVALERWLSDCCKKYVIRAQHLRRKVLLQRQPSTLRNAIQLAHRSITGIVERDGKEYEMRVAETLVTFTGLSWRGCKRGERPKKGQPLPVRVVIVELYNRGRCAYQWVLLTNLDESAEKIARIYTWRWRVERLFFLLKVGIHMPLWEEQSGERIARRLALTSLAAMALYQMQSPPPDPAKVALVHRIAAIGGWYGRKCDPIGPIVLMRGMLRFLETLALIEEYGVDDLRAAGAELSQLLGVPVPGLGPPLRKSQESPQTAHMTPAVPRSVEG
jgi:hypothetical protein